jgi:hypothetical protein
MLESRLENQNVPKRRVARSRSESRKDWIMWIRIVEAV